MDWIKEEIKDLFSYTSDKYHGSKIRRGNPYDPKRARRERRRQMRHKKLLAKHSQRRKKN
jgi:hypothetical protein